VVGGLRDMRKTERFRSREKALETAFHPGRMKSVWKKQVRSILRNQAVNDLHDYYDFHIHLAKRIESIRSSIFRGIYQPSRPIRVRSEKKLGISRQLVILRPDDALVFESLGDYLMEVIEKHQPSKKAYFSRNRSKPKRPEEFSGRFGYPWWILWPEFQKEIFEFASKHKYTVVTDVANYYDGIVFSHLRNFLSSMDTISEGLLDFLFYLLERFVWRPDYLPFSGKGLPQINLDAPRLMAHAFLFEVDKFLDAETDGDFVRWLDDIDFGCDSEKKGKEILGNIDDLLLSRSLHLNTSKTKILNSLEAFQHFQIDENRYLTIFNKRISRKLNDGKTVVHPELLVERKRLRKRFRRFYDDKSNITGQWDKIIKRYINTFGKLGDDFLVEVSKKLIINNPSLRETIFRYYKSLGWSTQRERIVADYIQSAIDDDSLFNAIDILLFWQGESVIKYILRNREIICKLNDNDTTINFLCSLWLICKFGNEDLLDQQINMFIRRWRGNDWIARQVAATYPLLSSKTKSIVMEEITSYGLKSAKQVIDNYMHINNKDKRDLFVRVKPYVLAPMKWDYYPLWKFLLSMSILKGHKDIRVKLNLKKELLSVIDDPVYRMRIKQVDI
jgi:hypothetical protein